MQEEFEPPEIFDRNRRQAKRERAARKSGTAFLWTYIAQEIEERLSLVSREFSHALFIGPMAYHAEKILGNRTSETKFSTVEKSSGLEATSAQEDRLPFDPHSFDLIIAAGTLDSVNDLPGALVQIRHILKPDGLFLGHMFGAGSLASLKSVMLAAEGPVNAPHIHPQIDLRSAADLLSRARFTLPVADADTLRIAYAHWRTLVDDLRNAGIGNALCGQRRYLGKSFLENLDREWTARADHTGRVEEAFVHLFLSGWSPSDNQPKPARRGSADVSLASVLRPAAKI
ncbi:MAG: class I SAM-dependent methyltransferase [Sphingorhabdus sp.]|uniref:class I SAM-dependent methyltransferase n=1 Tax=Sphingorhabdus sp. TaxID=1902408 RepID=UPI0038FD0213